MCNRSWIYVLPLTVLFALLATTSQAQEAIGKATSVSLRRKVAMQDRFQAAQMFIRRKQFALEIPVRRTCNFTIAAT